MDLCILVYIYFIESLHIIFYEYCVLPLFKDIIFFIVDLFNQRILPNYENPHAKYVLPA